MNFRAARNTYTQIDPARMVSEVVANKADVAVAFAPDVARYVKDSSQPLRMTLVPDDTVRSDGQKMPQSFDQSMRESTWSTGEPVSSCNACRFPARPSASPPRRTG